MTKVLFTSDDAVSAQTFADLIKPFDLSTSGYGDTQDVIGHQLIVCDLNDDPGACAREVTRLRSLCGFRDIPILIAAFDGMIGEGKRLIGNGANGILRKPFSAGETGLMLEQALQPVGIRTKIDMGVVAPFIDATVEVIRKTTGTEVKRTDLFLKKSYSMFGDVSGVMGLTGSTEGVVALTFHEELAFVLVSRIVGCEPTELTTEDVHDGIGEIINMISGNAKRVLSENRRGFNISIPTVIIGHGHQIAHRRNQPVIVILFESEGSPFAVQLCVSSDGSGLSQESKAGVARPVGMNS